MIKPTNQRGADLHKSSLAINDISGSYHISTSNKGGYGNRINSRCVSNCDRRYGFHTEDRNGTRRQITLINEAR